MIKNGPTVEDIELVFAKRRRASSTKLMKRTPAQNFNLESKTYFVSPFGTAHLSTKSNKNKESRTAHESSLQTVTTSTLTKQGGCRIVVHINLGKEEGGAEHNNIPTSCKFYMKSM